MDDRQISRYPAHVEDILAESRRRGFGMASEPQTGALLRMLAAAKPGGRFLELGTGTGLSAAWLLDGMDDDARLVTVDNDLQAQAVARHHLGQDPRIEFVQADGDGWLQDNRTERFDLIFADAWPGKFTHLDLTLSLLQVGGFYMIDDLLPQANWPPGHAPRVPALLNELESEPGLVTVRMAWASGLLIAVKTG